MSESTYRSLTASDVAKKLTEMAKEKKKLLICAHRNPDGDAVGSAFALKLIYEKLSGSAYCVSSDEVPDYLRFLLKGQSSIKFSENIEYDTIVSVDTASPEQLGDLIFLCNEIVMSIDHHESCTPYCDEYRNKDASAAGELIMSVYEYLVENKEIEADADIARLIYAAISADTGSFKYSNTTYDTHMMAARLVKTVNSDKNGINTAEISRLIHNSKSLKALKAEKLSIENLNTAENGKIAYVVLKTEQMEENGLTEDDFGSAVDIPRSIEGVLLSFVIKESNKKSENKEKVFRVSARSSCEVSVADICKKFGGGGHAKAAGATIYAENAEKAKEILLSEFEKALKGEN